MAPEAISTPETVDARSDLYALGAVAWFLLVGRPPFEGRTIVEVCGHHLHTPPVRPSTPSVGRFPPDLEDAVLACLEKSPEARPPVHARCATFSSARPPQGSGAATDAAAWWQERQPRTAASVEHALGRTIELDMDARATTTVGAKSRAPEG